MIELVREKCPELAYLLSPVGMAGFFKEKAEYIVNNKGTHRGSSASKSAFEEPQRSDTMFSDTPSKINMLLGTSQEKFNS
jgi:hypothetical protein